MKKGILILALLLLAGGCATVDIMRLQGVEPSSYGKVAIIDFVSAPEDPYSGKEVADLFSFEMSKKGYAFIDRNRSEMLLKEKGINIAGMQGSYAEIGKALGAGAILTGEVRHYIDETERFGMMLMSFTEHRVTVTFNARLVDVATGETLWSAFASWTKEDSMTNLTTVAKKLVKRCIKKFPKAQ